MSGFQTNIDMVVVVGRGLGLIKTREAYTLPSGTL